MNLEENAELIWVTGDGRRIRLRDMTDEHLENAIAWAKRRVNRNEDTALRAYVYAGHAPDGAAMAAELDADRLMNEAAVLLRWVGAFKREQQRRKRRGSVRFDSAVFRLFSVGATTVEIHKVTDGNFVITVDEGLRTQVTVAGPNITDSVKEALRRYRIRRLHRAVEDASKPRKRRKKRATTAVSDIFGDYD